MTFIKGNDIFLVTILALLCAPHHCKLSCLAFCYFVLIIAAFIDWAKNTKRVKRFTRRVATCSCVKARETISHLQVPKLFQINCTVCGAKAS